MQPGEIKVKEIEMATLTEILPQKITELKYHWNLFRQMLINNGCSKMESFCADKIYSSVSDDLFFKQINQGLVSKEQLVLMFSKNIFKTSLWKNILLQQPQIDKHYSYRQQGLFFDISDKPDSLWEFSFSVYDTIKDFAREIQYAFIFNDSVNTFCLKEFQASYEGLNQIFEKIDSSKLYFPLTKKIGDSLGAKGTLDTFTNQWFSGELKNMHEPILSKSTDEEFVCRFTYLPAFDAPSVYRIDKTDEGMILISKTLRWLPEKYEYEVIEKTQKLDMFELSTFSKKFSQLDFFKFPSEDPDERGMDGSEWILEANQKGNYHFAERWIGGSEAYKDCCSYLLFISDLKVYKKEIY